MDANRRTRGVVSTWSLIGTVVVVGVLAGAFVMQAQDGPPIRLGRVPQQPRMVPPGPTPPTPNSAVSIFEEHRNPGSAANPDQPGRVRPDAPAQFEVVRSQLAESLEVQTGATLNEPHIPVPYIEPDPRFQGTMRLSTDMRSDDFPDIASNPADPEQVWVVWQSYSGRRDQIHLMPFLVQQGIWSTFNNVPGVTGDVYRPRLAFDGQGRVWVIWAQQELYDANFDLYARYFDKDHWGPLEKLTSAPEGDFNHAVAQGADGAIHVVWQGFRNGQSDIFYMKYTADGGWSQEQRMSSSEANDWAPSLAVGRDGTAHIAWDTYDTGNYDVMLRSVAPGGTLSEVSAVAATEFFEARPSVVVDDQNRIWVAYEVGEMNWGKDQGQTVVPDPAPGARLNEYRQVQVRVLDGDRWSSPKPEVSSLFPDTPPIRYGYEPKPMISNPLLAVDGAGRVHLVVRCFFTQGGGYDQNWSMYLTTMTADGWTQPVPVPYSDGRLSMFAAAAPAVDGSLWLAWPRDNNLTISIFINLPEETIIENVYAARFASDVPAASGAKLGEIVAPDFPRRPENDPQEAEHVAAMRSWRARVGGENLEPLRGDTHRHTELSPDLRAVPDGSALDFYRYVLDAASLDFGLMTDHQAGGDREYWWWYTEKLADLFYSPERYIPMFGYERSVSYPNGHRNIIHDRRGVEHIPFFLDLGETPLRLHNGCTAVTADDTKALYEALRKSGGIALPHTPATTMGTDWRDNDPEVEPAVEIFQGDRFSYEREGAPLTDPGKGESSFLTRIMPLGFVSHAWDKGYRLGVESGSDHISTHISYAVVWAPERTRKAVLEAFKARHVYAATDNIILEFWMGDHFMGEEFAAEKVPQIRVRAAGTAPVAAVEIIRNNRSVYHNGGGSTKLELTYQDTAPESGTSFYYVRLEQVDGNVAWSSPVWIRMPE